MKSIKLSRQEANTILFFLEDLDIDGLGINRKYDFYAARLPRLIERLRR